MTDLFNGDIDYSYLFFLVVDFYFLMVHLLSDGPYLFSDLVNFVLGGPYLFSNIYCIFFSEVERGWGFLKYPEGPGDEGGCSCLVSSFTHVCLDFQDGGPCWKSVVRAISSSGIRCKPCSVDHTVTRNRKCCGHGCWECIPCLQRE